jgi:hypothetical protein
MQFCHLPYAATCRVNSHNLFATIQQPAAGRGYDGAAKEVFLKRGSSYTFHEIPVGDGDVCFLNYATPIQRVSRVLESIRLFNTCVVILIGKRLPADKKRSLSATSRNTPTSWNLKSRPVPV